METQRRNFIAQCAAFGMLVASLSGGAIAGTQNKSDPEGLKVVLLGTAGGPPPQQNRSQPANLLQIGGRNYLIDVGENAGQQAMRAGVMPRAVTAAFVTHLHWDHTLGIDYVMASGWIQGRLAAMPIYGPPGLTQFVEREIASLDIGGDIFRNNTQNAPSLTSLFPSREINVDGPTQVFADDAVRVTAVANSHYATFADVRRSYGRDRSYSYRFDTRFGSVVFTGDTGSAEAVVALARNADVLVTEIVDVESVLASIAAVNPHADLKQYRVHMEHQHLTAEAVADLAARAGVRKLVLSHFVTGPRFDPKLFVERIRKAFAGEIVLGSDLMTIPVRGFAAKN